MKIEQLNKIFMELEQTKPIIRLTRGLNNKETYYNADNIWAILKSVDNGLLISIADLKECFDKFPDCHCKYGVCSTCEDCQACSLFKEIVTRGGGSFE